MGPIGWLVIGPFLLLGLLMLWSVKIAFALVMFTVLLCRVGFHAASVRIRNRARKQPLHVPEPKREALPVSPLLPASTVAAGWYPDPDPHGQPRWWDGYRWTEHVR